MIYACTLAKYLINGKISSVVQSNIKDITTQLLNDPAISGMDIVALTTRDLTSIAGKKLVKELPKRHPDIKVIYIYTGSPDLVQDDEDTKKFKVSRLSVDAVKKIMDAALADIPITTKEKKQFSNDAIPKTAEKEKDKEKKGLFGLFKSAPKEKAPKKQAGNRVKARTTKSLDLGIKESGKGYDSSGFDDAPMVDDDFPDVTDQKDYEIDNSQNDIPGGYTAGYDFPMDNDDNEQPANMSQHIENERIIKKAENNQDLPVDFDNAGTDTPMEVKTEKSLGDLEFPDVKRPKDEPEIQVQEPSLADKLAAMPVNDSISYVKSIMNKAAIKRELLSTDTEYANALYTLDAWDREISEIYISEMSAKEKWCKIREIALKRSDKKGQLNSKIIDKTSSLIATLTSSCMRAVQEEVSEIKTGLATVVDAQVVNLNEEEVEKLIKDREEIAAHLRELLAGIIEIYKIMDVNVEDIISDQDEGLPSSNYAVQNRLSLEADYFKPQNMGALTAKILSDLKNGLVQFSQMETTLVSLITDVFRLIDKDSAIIKEQEDRYKKLKSVRVEETVTITAPIKNCLRVFIGPNDTGVTATALTWAGLRSRRQNTLLVDIRKDGRKTTNYGEEPQLAIPFISAKRREQFQVLRAEINSVYDMDELLAALESATDYYGSINIIMSDDQVEYCNRCIDKTLSLNVITNSTISSINKVKELLKEIHPENIALKLISVDPVLERMEFIQSLDYDNVFQLVAIPFIKDVRACGLRHEAPYQRDVVINEFEEAFR